MKDHQARIFHVLPRTAGKGDRCHLAGKIRRASLRAKVITLFGSLISRDNRRRNRLIIGRHLLGQNPLPGLVFPAFIARRIPFKIGQRILLT